MYKHTQIGYLIIYAFTLVIALFAFILWTEFTSFILVFMIITLGVLASFGSLTVTVEEKYVRIKFGYGIYSKRFAVSEIQSVAVARNHWYFGWGIRYWFWPRMTIFNVSGYDAVEMVMKDGTVFRIGTDEPDPLEMAIRKVMKK